MVTLGTCTCKHIHIVHDMYNVVHVEYQQICLQYTFVFMHEHVQCTSTRIKPHYQNKKSVCPGLKP